MRGLHRFSLGLALFLLPGLAHAQMGPAGPPGGPTVGTGGQLKAYVGSPNGPIEASSTAVGRSATLVYVPTPGFYGPLDYVRVYTRNQPGDPASNAVDFYLSSLTTGIYQPAEPWTLNVVADAYESFTNHVVDKATTPLYFKWTPIDKIGVHPINNPPQAGNTITLPFKALCSESQQLAGPGARYQLAWTYRWKDANGFQIFPDTPHVDLNDRFGPDLSLPFDVPAIYNTAWAAVQNPLMVNGVVLTLEIDFTIKYASTPGGPCVNQKTMTNSVNFMISRVLDGTPSPFDGLPVTTTPMIATYGGFEVPIQWYGN